jgi:hypothetical protein
MRDLVLELLPHAPQLGLFTAPEIPRDRLRNAIADYALDVRPDEVLALYDATFLGNAKDGAVFTADRVVFQNNNLEPAHTIKYADIVAVDSKRKLLGGRRVSLDVNRGRATISLSIDFSGKPDAAQYVERFLHEAMIQGAAAEMDETADPNRTGTGSDKIAVQKCLDDLLVNGAITEPDYRAFVDLLERL